MPQYIEMAAHQLRTSKVVKVESTRKTDRGLEFFLIWKDLPKPMAGKPTEQVTMVVEQDGEAQVVMAYLSGRSGRFVGTVTDTNYST